MDYDTLDRLNVRQSRARAGNSCIACSRADLESIVRAHGSMVYRLALVQTRNCADAEDVFQDVFVALVRRMARGGRGFESAEHVRAWLLRATIDRGRDLARAAWRRRTQSLDEFPAELAEGLFSLCARPGASTYRARRGAGALACSRRVAAQVPCSRAPVLRRGIEL